MSRKLKTLEKVQQESATGWRKEKPVWKFFYLDWNFPAKVQPQRWAKVVERLKALESQTWEVIGRDKHNHEWPSTSEWAEDARRRWKLLGVPEDINIIYQLHLDNMGRIYGFLIDFTFYLVWLDDEHKVYRTKPR